MSDLPFIDLEDKLEWYNEINSMYIRLKSYILKCIGDDVDTEHKDMILKNLSYKLSNGISDFLYNEINTFLKKFTIYDNSEWIYNTVNNIVFSINSTFIALDDINKLVIFNSHDIYQLIYKIITNYLHDNNMNGILDSIIDKVSITTNKSTYSSSSNSSESESCSNSSSDSSCSDSESCSESCSDK